MKTKIESLERSFKETKSRFEICLRNGMEHKAYSEYMIRELLNLVEAIIEILKDENNRT